MIKFIYLNKSLKTVPLNGLVRIDGLFFRRGYADRRSRQIQLVRVNSAGDPVYNEISFVPNTQVCQFYKEFGLR